MSDEKTSILAKDEKRPPQKLGIDELLSRAIAQLDRDSLLEISKRFRENPSKCIPTEKTMALLSAAVEQNSPGAQVVLGQCHAAGVGAKKDLKMAADLYELAAKQGFPLGQTCFGELYRDHKLYKPDLQKYYFTGVAQREYEHERSTYWFEEAAKKREVGALHALAKIYWDLKKYDRSFLYHKQAAELGLAESQCSLGYMYVDGRGVKHDLESAQLWFMVAANQGDPDAKAMIARRPWWERSVRMLAPLAAALSDEKQAYSFFREEEFRNFTDKQIEIIGVRWPNLRSCILRKGIKLSDATLKSWFKAEEKNNDDTAYLLLTKYALSPTITPDEWMGLFEKTGKNKQRAVLSALFGKDRNAFFKKMGPTFSGKLFKLQEDGQDDGIELYASLLGDSLAAITQQLPTQREEKEEETFVPTAPGDIPLRTFHGSKG